MFFQATRSFFIRAILAALLFSAFAFVASSHATTSRASRGITIDGSISDWNQDELVYEDSADDSPFGTNSDLQQLYVSWDNSNFYMAVVAADCCKAMVVFISTGLGGITDASAVRNTGGTADNANYNWWWGSKHYFPADFTPQFQWNSYGMRVDPNDASHGFFHLEGNPIRPVARVIQQALVQSNQPGFGAMEIAIPWDTLFEGIVTPAGFPKGIPADAKIKIWVGLKDGEGKSARESIPNQVGTFSSDGNSYFTIDSFVTIPVGLSTGTPIFGVSAVPRTFQATASPQQTVLSWAKRGAFENYLKYFAVERSSDNFATSAIITTTTATSFTDDNLINSTTYNYRIRAYYDLPGQGVVAAAGATQIKNVVPLGPKITHAPLTQFAYPNQPMRFQATIPAPAGETLSDLTLFWRPKGSSGFSSTVSTKSKTGDTYLFEISSGNVNPPGIDYYIQAKSNSGVTVVPNGAPASFFTVNILGTVVQPVDSSKDATVILPSEQGALGTTSLFIPAFALPGSKSIGIESKTLGDIIADGQQPAAPTSEITNTEPAAIYDLYTLDAAGNKISVSFSKKATLTLRYFQSTIDSVGLDAARLRVYRWSGTNWIRLGGTVDTQKQVVMVQTDHLSRYALFETSTDFLSQTSSKLKQVVRSTFFPHLGEVLEFVVDSPPAGTSLNIYTAKGSPVRSLTDTLIWDGKNDSGDTVESGLYIYQLQLEGKKISGSCVIVR